MAIALRNTTLLRLALPDRPGGLGHVARALAAAGVDILRLEVVERGGAEAVDDLLVAGGDLEAGLAELAPDVRVLARRDGAELPDPALAMAGACAELTAATSAGEVRRRLLDAAMRLLHARSGFLLRDAGHGWLRPLASSIENLPPVRAGDPALARTVLRSAQPLVVDADSDWAPPLYRDRFRGGQALLLPAGMPPFLVLTLVRDDGFPFLETEIERVEALVRVALGVLLAYGERPVRAPESPAVHLRLGSMV